MTFKLHAIDNSFARQVLGVNLWELLGDDQHAQESAKNPRAQLKTAFSEHPVLVFRRQSLTEDELVELGRILGTPMEYVERSWHSSRPRGVTRFQYAKQCGRLHRRSVFKRTELAHRPVVQRSTGNGMFLVRASITK